MRIVAIIQTRMSSTRLPGKVLLPLNGRPVLQHVYERVSKADIDEVVIATSTENSDNVIEKYCYENAISCYRGDLHNVLSRYYSTAKKYKADVIVRITADCPMYDYTILNKMIPLFENCDYMSNCIIRSFPRGLDTEIFTMGALRQAAQNASTDFDKEHVTPYIRSNELFTRKNYKSHIDNSAHRWTLDTNEDYQMIKALFNKLGNQFTSNDAIAYLYQNPNIFALNNHIQQKEK